jgi:hypothetical protein
MVSSFEKSKGKKIGMEAQGKADLHCSIKGTPLTKTEK